MHLHKNLTLLGAAVSALKVTQAVLGLMGTCNPARCMRKDTYLYDCCMSLLTPQSSTVLES